MLLELTFYLWTCLHAVIAPPSKYPSWQELLDTLAMTGESSCFVPTLVISFSPSPATHPSAFQACRPSGCTSSLPAERRTL